MNKILTEKDILNKLKQVEFFAAYADNEDVIMKIYGMCTRKRKKRGGIIIKEGDTGDELYIIIRGKIEILKKTLQNEKYTVIILNSDKRGGITVGELGLFDKDRRSATVIASTDCEYLVINRKKFIKFGDENPEIGLGITRAIITQLARSLRKSNYDIIILFSALVEEVAGDE